MKTRLLTEKEDGVYHVVCRTAFQMDKLSDESKKVFMALLKKQAYFSGVEVVTFCLLDNHVHLLIKIPYLKNISDQEIVQRYRRLYGEEGTEYVMPPSALAKLFKENGENAAKVRKQLTARMQNLSIFVKELKLRFGIWFNRRYENKGTLWADKFHSVLVQNNDEIIALVAAYIDMNPVRLKKCEEPVAYAYSNFKNNAYYRVLKNKQASKIPGESSMAGIESGQSIHAISHGKVIGNRAFVQACYKTHQSGLKSKSKCKWAPIVAKNLLWACCSLADLHVQKKMFLP